MKNYHQALLYYQIAENLFQNNKERFPEKSVDSIDDLHKLKIVYSLANEKNENMDKIGNHFHKMYLYLFLKIFNYSKGILIQSLNH
jgi:hypothetical protein